MEMFVNIGDAPTASCRIEEADAPSATAARGAQPNDDDASLTALAQPHEA